MAELLILFTSLTIFGVGVTIIDFLGLLDPLGNNDGNDTDDSSAESANDDDFSAAGDTSNAKQIATQNATQNAAQNAAQNASILSPDKKNKNEKPGIRIITGIMGLLRSAVYFSLGFGPTGLFASFTGLSRTSGLIWACAVGAGMIILARLLKRVIRKDLDSSIKPDELLQEKGVLLLPLEGEAISKAVVRQYGREIEIYVRCKIKDVRLPKGKIIVIEDYDNDTYWVEPVNEIEYNEKSI